MTEVSFSYNVEETVYFLLKITINFLVSGERSFSISPGCKTQYGFKFDQPTTTMFPQLRLLKQSLTPAQHQRDRLRSALPLIRAKIPCVIWAEDALNFVHRVPTLLFDQQLIVPSNQVGTAVDAICAEFPEYHVGSIETHPRWKDFASNNEGGGSGDGEGSRLTSSVLLVNSNSGAKFSPHDPTPIFIIIHAASTFHFKIDDPSLTCSNPLLLDSEGGHPEAQTSDVASYDAFRYPTVSTFCDIIIDTIHEPPLVNFINKELLEHLKLLLAYLILYTIADEGCTTFPSEPDDDDPSANAGYRTHRNEPNMDMIPHAKPLKILPTCEIMLEEIKEENRPFLRRIFMHRPPSNREEECTERILIKQERLKRLGQTYDGPVVPFNPDRAPAGEALRNLAVPVDQARDYPPMSDNSTRSNPPLPAYEAQRNPPPPFTASPKHHKSMSPPPKSSIAKFMNLFKLPSSRDVVSENGRRY